MDVSARMTSKGQVTVPKEVRDALELKTGDSVLFRVEGHVALMARTPSLLELAGTIDVPAHLRGATVKDLRNAVRDAHVARVKRGL